MSKELSRLDRLNKHLSRAVINQQKHPIHSNMWNFHGAEVYRLRGLIKQLKREQDE